VIALLCAAALGLTQCGPSSIIFGKGTTAIDLGTKTAAEKGDRWEYDEAADEYRILDGAQVTIFGGTKESRVVVTGGAVVTVTLSSASIDCSGKDPVAAPSLETWDMKQTTPVYLESGSNALLKLSGASTVKGGYWSPGIYVHQDAALTITSSQDGGETGGILIAEGGYYGAGIGGLHQKPSGTIVITGGTIMATGGTYGSGIGGAGLYGSNGKITISGGEVYATGKGGGAGIGGGIWGGSDSIIISGGTGDARSIETVTGFGIGHGVGPGDGFPAFGYYGAPAGAAFSGPHGPLGEDGWPTDNPYEWFAYEFEPGDSGN
jgi:hypothetical protein